MYFYRLYSIDPRLKPKRDKAAKYEPPEKLPPSRALAPISLDVTEGEHTLTLKLPKKRSGCVALEGVKLGPSPEELATSA